VFDSTSYSFPAYLSAKKSVDDRALNRHVWQSLVNALPPLTPESPLRVLDVGAGTGVMLERMLEWRLLTDAAYTAIDADSGNIDSARQSLPRWAGEQGFRVSEAGAGRMLFERDEQNISVELEAIDIFAFIEREQNLRKWDLLVAHAFLDLMNLETTLPALFNVVSPGGLFYFTINFDGATIFEPEIDSHFDALIETLYHRTADERRIAHRPSGDSRAGRHLFHHLREAGARILDAGSSDWVVFAGPDGYPGNEAYFLHFIINTIRAALLGHPQLDPERFSRWIDERHHQVEQGTLTYIAHQLDFLGRVPPRL
jgi:SAM-dependent methyltransferase